MQGTVVLPTRNTDRRLHTLCPRLQQAQFEAHSVEPRMDTNRHEWVDGTPPEKFVLISVHSWFQFRSFRRAPQPSTG